MTNSEKLTKWIKDKTDLSWSRTEGDSPAIKQDSYYINRSEAYEIRDLMMTYYKEKNLEHSEENYKKTLNKIINYKRGQKLKRQEMLDYLISSVK